MEKWQITAKVVFYVLIPGVILYYRFRKKFRTAFALGMALTSIFVGFLVSQSFRESYQDRFVRLINEDRYEEARLELQKMLQRDPAELGEIDLHRKITPVMYERMKKELAAYYTAEAEKAVKSLGEAGPDDCASLHARRLRLHGMNHSLRLCAMAEALGAATPEWQEKMRRGAESEQESLSRLEDRCR